MSSPVRASQNPTFPIAARGAAAGAPAPRESRTIPAPARRPLAHAVRVWLAATALVFGIPPGGASVQTPDGYAEGTTGGAGHPIVLVTTLEDYDVNLGEPVIAGSLRWALSGSNRQVHFTVAGEIHLKRKLEIRGRTNLTLDGSAAPAPGVTLRFDQLEIRDSSNIIVRHIRSRDTADKASNIPAIVVYRNCDHIWIDHVSVSRSSDESIGVTGGVLGGGRPTNVTISWVLIADAVVPAYPYSGKGILVSGSGSGPAGTPVSGEMADRVTIHHNVLTNNHQRNPQISGNVDSGINEPRVDLRNNIIHDWHVYGTRVRYAASANVVKNLYISAVKPYDALILDAAGPVFTAGNVAPPQGSAGVDINSLGTAATPLAAPPITEHAVAALPGALLGDGISAGVGALPRDAYDAAVVARLAGDLAAYLPLCAQAGGDGCAFGEICSGGSFTPSADHGSLCCVGGACLPAGHAGDADGDTVPDASDNCPNLSNAGQEDLDGDGVGDLCDNCFAVQNPVQEDSDADGTGDACDPCPQGPDADQDEVCDDADNCPGDYNPAQEDADGDGSGDACDSCAGTDGDGDGVCDGADNCPAVYNPDQENTDADAEGGDACDITVTGPLSGEVTCADPPPTITWTPEIYDRFKVFIGADPLFSVRVRSGKTFLRTTSWTVPAKKWRAICRKANPYLYIKVLGKIAGTRTMESSEVVVIDAR